MDRHGVQFDRIVFGREVKKSAQLESDRISQGPVGTNDLPENFVGKRNISAKILRANP